MIKVPLSNPKPDIDNFIKVIKGEIIPQKPPLVELFLDYEIVRDISKNFLNKQWVETSEDKEQQKKYLTNWIEVYWRTGYDFVRMTGGLEFQTKSRQAEDASSMSGKRNWAEEGKGPISTWEEFEKYPWPDVKKADLWQYESVAKNIPQGMGLFVCPTSGFLEIPLDILFGYENLCYLLYDQPELVEAVFKKAGETIYQFYERLLGLPNLVGFFQGDDMGYKTGTLISAEHLKRLSLPWHKKLAHLAHKNSLIYILHSCGQLDEIMNNLIDDVKIDARHSFEDEGNPVIEFKKKYGKKIGVLGGIDVDKLCRLSEDRLRVHIRNIIKECLPDGRFAVGSGNTVANYVPVANYIAMVEEALNFF